MSNISDSNDLTTNDSADMNISFEDQYKRALADYQNLVRQHQRERLDYIKYANQNLISDLLPIIDNLQKASDHIKDPGVVMVIKQFQDFLSNQGLEEINPNKGDSFDETLHECIEVVPVKDKQNDKLIAECVQVGYRWSGDDAPVLRHARVTVNQFNKSNKKEENNS